MQVMQYADIVGNGLQFSARPIKDTEMGKRFAKKIRDLLSNQRKELMCKVHDLEVDLEGDDTDVIQGKMILALNTKLSHRDRNKLVQVEAALKRLDEGKYGLCNECGEEISEKRLMANPYFSDCIDCAETREREQKRNYGGLS